MHLHSGVQTGTLDQFLSVAFIVTLMKMHCLTVVDLGATVIMVEVLVLDVEKNSYECRMSMSLQLMLRQKLS